MKISRSELTKPVDDETRKRQREAFDRAIRKRDEELKALSPVRKIITRTNLSVEDADNCHWSKLKINDTNKLAWNRLQKWTPEKEWGVFLYGAVGTGKTHLLKGLMIHWALAKETTGWFYSLQDLANDFRRYSYDDHVSLDEFKFRLNQRTIFVIDDFGAEKTSEFVQSELLSFIDKRISKNKPVFVSANYSPRELSKIYDKRILDRLQALMTFTKCDGDSYRRVIAQERLEREKF